MREMLEKAKIFASKVHDGQMYGNVPYIVHLSDVYVVLHDHNITDENILVAAWLHDTIEDTTATYSKIEKRFNKEIAEIVYCLTDELGRNRKERHEKTYPKLKKNKKAIVVKQADRLANIKTGLREGNDLLYMYIKEYPEFRKQLKPHGGDKKMWKELDDLLLGTEE